MPSTFPLEASLFYADLDAKVEPLQLRSRASDGSLYTLELSTRVLWAASGIRCRITTATELQNFESFYLANRSTPFLCYDPTRSNVHQESVGTGNGSTTAFSFDHTYVTSGTLLVYVDGVLKTETTHYTVNYSTGVVTFGTAPAGNKPVTASYRFRRLVLFDGGYTWRKRAIPDGTTISATQLGIVQFDLVESVNA